MGSDLLCLEDYDVVRDLPPEMEMCFIEGFLALAYTKSPDCKADRGLRCLLLLLPLLRISRRNTVELGLMLCKLEYLQEMRTGVLSKEE